MKRDILIEWLQKITEDNPDIFCLDEDGYGVPIKTLTVRKIPIPFKDQKTGWGGTTDDKVFILEGYWTEEEINNN